MTANVVEILNNRAAVLAVGSALAMPKASYGFDLRITTTSSFNNKS